ncbi:hypothetical protein H2248_003315 [Termitomyces sp. 'cryptogamus']|nr:hypothetical protein H2248_003315 [Termitomyces sp. 'cryptogamus']
MSLVPTPPAYAGSRSTNPASLARGHISGFPKGSSLNGVGKRRPALSPHPRGGEFCGPCSCIYLSVSTDKGI